MRYALRRTAVVLTLLVATMLHSLPAGAATAFGGGSLNGIMLFEPGIPTNPFAPANANVFAYVSTTTTGSLLLTDGLNSAMYAGTVNLVASGVGFESFAVGTGNINDLSGSGTSATGAVQMSLAAPQGPGENTYIRAGVTLVAILRLDVIVHQWVYGIRITVTGSVAVRIAASTVPTSRDSPLVTEMVVSGPFTVAS